MSKETLNFNSLPEGIIALILEYLPQIPYRLRASNINSRVRRISSEAMGLWKVFSLKGQSGESLSLIRSITPSSPLSKAEIVDLRGRTELRDSDLEHLASVCMGMKLLYIENCPAITDRGLEALGKCSSNLEYLSIGFVMAAHGTENARAAMNGCTDEGFAALSSGCKELKFL